MQPFNIQTSRLQIIWFIGGSPWLALQQVTKAHNPNFCFQSCSRSSSTCSSWFLLLFCETCGRRYKIKLPWAHLHNNCQTLVGPHSEYCSWVCPKTSNWMKSKSFYELWCWHHIKTSSSVWPQSERNSHHEEHKKTDWKYNEKTRVVAGKKEKVPSTQVYDFAYWSEYLSKGKKHIKKTRNIVYALPAPI